MTPDPIYYAHNFGFSSSINNIIDHANKNLPPNYNYEIITTRHYLDGRRSHQLAWHSSIEMREDPSFLLTPYPQLDNVSIIYRGRSQRPIPVGIFTSNKGADHFVYNRSEHLSEEEIDKLYAWIEEHCPERLNEYRRTIEPATQGDPA